MGSVAGVAPSLAYIQGARAGQWSADPGQQAVLPELDRIHAGLSAGQARSVFRRLTSRLWAPPLVKGLYLWGGVGRGKTFLVDLLYDQVTAPKQRWHFHRFMGEVHARLRALPDTADTLSVVAADLSADLRLLLLDEFFVGDIGDAMILGRLLDQLIERGVTLVTTSNIAPSDLYRDGLQRASFLPCIALIERHCRVVKLDSGGDYRLRQLTQEATYLTPLGEASENALAEHFNRLAGKADRSTHPMPINDRALPVRMHADGVAWFEFSQLCEGPRAVSDYIEIARRFHTVLLSNVPLLDRNMDDAARRFIHLVDEFYDRHVNLLVSAAAQPGHLYLGQKLKPEFERASSRLIEMQSAEYLAREHRP